jgi:hypothetical protein
MKKFTLLINGKDVDTGIYDYFPYIDKAIIDFRGKGTSRRWHINLWGVHV